MLTRVVSVCLVVLLPLAISSTARAQEPAPPEADTRQDEKPDAPAKNTETRQGDHEGDHPAEGGWALGDGANRVRDILEVTVVEHQRSAIPRMVERIVDLVGGCGCREDGAERCHGSSVRLRQNFSVEAMFRRAEPTKHCERPVLRPIP